MTLTWFVSVDDHLIEPARLWQERLPARCARIGSAHRARGRHRSSGCTRTARSSPPALNAVAGKRREEFSPEPITYDDMRPGCYVPAERVADMNRGLVLSSLLFPSFPRYCGQVFHEAKDKELALLCVQAWNDFILEEFADAYPGRFIPMMIIPLWDPAAAVDEIERTAARGAKSIAFSENPTKLKLPSIHTDYWDPVFRCAEETGFVLSMHVGSSSNMIKTSDDMPTLAAMAYWSADQPGRGPARLAFQWQLRTLPKAEDRPVGGFDRLDPLLPREGRAGGRQTAVLGVSVRHRPEPEP